MVDEPDDEELDEELDEDDDDEDDGEPWPIARRPPASIEAWVAELIAAYPLTEDPPPLETEDGREFVPGTAGSGESENAQLLEAGVLLCLRNRGARIPVEAVYGLIGVIEDMVKDMSGMGPEWQRMQQVPPLAFTIYYVWAHIVIGHLSEDLAMEIVRGATERLEDFDISDGA